MRILCSLLLLLYCSISYGQTVIIDVPSPISSCTCSPCECVPLVPTLAPPAAVSVEVERTGILARLCGLRSGADRGPRFLLKIFTRNRPEPEPDPEVQGSVVVPPAPVAVSVQVRPLLSLRGF